jgi:hypothetical protein
MNGRTDREIRDDDLVEVRYGNIEGVLRQNQTLRAAHNAMRDSRTMVAAYFRRLVVEDAIRQKQVW